MSIPVEFSFRLARSINGFIRDRRANIAIAYSISLVPILTGVGAAIDYGRAALAREALQSSLDAGTLASAIEGTLDDAKSKAIFSNDLSVSGVTISNLAFSTDDDGNIVGVANAKLETTFAGIVGISSIPISVKAVAVPPSERISNVSFTPISAQGAYAKDIFFFTRDRQGNIIDKQTVLTYRYSTAKGGTRTTTPNTGQTSTISIDPYTTYGVGLVIYQDLTYTGRLVNAVTRYSDDADAATWIHTKDSCEDGGTQTNNVEDGGNSDFLDFIYTMSCTMDAGSDERVHLIR